MNDTEYTKNSPHFLIAGYGVEGITAAALLEHSEWLQSVENWQHGISFMKLGAEKDTTQIASILSDIDMVFILGSDDDITASPAALQLAKQCKDNGIFCLTALTIIATPNQMDSATESLCNLSSHCLLFPDTRPVDKLNSYLRLLETMKAFIGPLRGRGLIGVDMDDIRSVLNRGKDVCFSYGSAQGENRAQQAAQFAIQRLPEIRDAKSILCNITTGTDLTMAEVAIAGDLVREACNDYCIAVIVTTLDTTTDSRFQVTLIGVMDS